MKKIALVVPTRHRPDEVRKFCAFLKDIIQLHNALLYLVHDIEQPIIEVLKADGIPHLRQIDEACRHLVCQKTDAIRNAGFYEAIKDGADVIVTLDDDVLPIGDPIQVHLDHLGTFVATSWFNPCTNFMRGFPYGVRKESLVVASHGIWTGCPDIDSITQISGTAKEELFPYKGPIPNGCLTPVSGMNFAFTRQIAHKVYFAPMGEKYGYHRFADIWMGIPLKRWLDDQNLAMVHGYSIVLHERASDPMDNLVREAAGIRENEKMLPDNDRDYFNIHMGWANRWEDLIKSIM